MHTTKLGDGWIAIHHGQIEEDEDIRLRRLSSDEREVLEDYVLPYRVIRSLVASQIRDAKIGRLEQMTDTELLGDRIEE